MVPFYKVSTEKEWNKIKTQAYMFVLHAQV